MHRLRTWWNERVPMRTSTLALSVFWLATLVLYFLVRPASSLPADRHPTRQPTRAPATNVVPLPVAPSSTQPAPSSTQPSAVETPPPSATTGPTTTVPSTTAPPSTSGVPSSAPALPSPTGTPSG